MKKNHNNLGFSLTEMLIATGIMAIGLVMVSTIFPVGVKLTTLTTERTVGVVVADEAFAKIQLYGLRDFKTGTNNNWPVPDPNLACSDYKYVTGYAGPDGTFGTIDDNYMNPGPDGNWNTSDDIYWDSEFQYPSSLTLDEQDRNYHWSALCRRVGAKEVQVTVFVTRKFSSSAKFRSWDYDSPTNSYLPNANSAWPNPVPVNVGYYAAQPKELVIKDDPAFKVAESQYFFDDGYTIVDNLTGRIYRILEVKDTDSDNIPDTLVLMEDWQWDGYPLTPAVDETDRTIWVVPPAVNSDRYPCVGVYQKTIYFDGIK